MTHPEIIQQLAVKDMLFAYYKCPQVEKQVNLFLNYNLITYTFRGKNTFHHRDKSWTLTDNSCVFVRKTAFNQERDDMVGWEVLAFYFQDNFLQQVFREYRQYLPLKNLLPPPVDMLIEINVNETTSTFFYGMVPYFTQQVPPSESLLELKFKELLFKIFSDPANLNLISYINSIDDQLKTPLWQIMEANYTFNLNIDEFARIAQRSIGAFKREFYEYYHTTPGKWLTNKRLEYATSLLDTSKKNVSEITYVSGF